MKIIATWIILFGFLRGISSQMPASDHHWRLIYEEQFDSIDPVLWNVANDFDHFGEPQVYTNRAKNVYVANGELVLQVRNERYRCRDLSGSACNKSLYYYTSGWIESRQNHYLQFGFIESRIKIPYGFGFWPAFWTFVGDDIPNRHNAAEIDIFEMLGTEPSTIMGTNLHLAYCNCNENDCDCEFLNDQMCPEVDPEIYCHGLDIEIPDYADSYHSYAVEWTPSKIIWYVDGNMVRNSANPGIIDPVRIIFNLAITPWNLPNSSTPFPSSMYVDHLKIYQLEVDNETMDTCSFDFSQYEEKVKNTISLGREGCSVAIPVNSNVTLRAVEEIEINGEFYVPLGAQFYMDVNAIQ